MNFRLLSKGLFLSIFFLGSISLNAQDILYTDSLRHAIGKMTEPEQIKTLWNLSREYAFADSLTTLEIMSDLEKVVQDSKKLHAIKLAIEAQLLDAAHQVSEAKYTYREAGRQLASVNEIQKSAQIISDLAILCSQQSEFDSLLFYARQSQKAFLKIADTMGLSSTYTNIGRGYHLLGQLDSAVVNFFRAIDLVEAYRPSPSFYKVHLRQVGNVYNNLGITYLEKGDLTNARKFYYKAIAKKKELGDLTEVGNMMINLGGIKFESGDPAGARSYLDTAAYYYNQTHHIPGLIMCTGNSAAVSNMLEEYPQAINYAKESVNLAKNVNDQTNIALGFIHLGTAYWKLANKKLSDIYLDSAFVVGRKIESKNIIHEVQNLRYEFALEEKDFEKALKYRNQYFATQDSMYQIQKTREISELETRYKTSEKEKEIAFLSQQAELQEAKLERNTFLMVGMIFMFIGLILVFYLLRIKAQNKFNAQLQEQKISIRENQIKAVIASQEQERKRFAKDLHDGMGQLFSALQLNIQAMTKPNKDPETQAELFDNSTKLLQDIHGEIRNIAFNLMPQTLLQSGLIAALEELIVRINRTNQLTVQLSVFDLDNRLPELMEVSLYRITQEFLSNIMKYSHAKNVFLNLTQHEDELIYTIEDDGKGYDLEHFRNNEGNGWRNINSRISLIKSSIEIETQPNSNGSTVIIQIPTTSIHQIAANEVAAEV